MWSELDMKLFLDLMSEGDAAYDAVASVLQRTDWARPIVTTKPPPARPNPEA
jgi:hypothetical protein